MNYVMFSAANKYENYLVWADETKTQHENLLVYMKLKTSINHLMEI